MKTTWCLCRRWAKFVPIAAILAVIPASSGPQAGPAGGPDDWSHRHVVFSHPGTAMEAIRNGTYAQWVRTVNDPRFIMQQQKRAAAARAGANFPLLRSDAETEAPDSEADSPEEIGPFADVPAKESLRGALLRNEEQAASGEDRRSIQRRRRVRGHRLQTDWSEDLGSGAKLGAGVYPAKYSFDYGTASCANDFVVYNTSLAGSAMQPSIMAFSNLYTGCAGGVPTVNWAFDTNGGTIVTSVTLSFDGKQLAFVQSTGGAARLVVLRWKSASGTLAAPTVPSSVTPTAYYNSGAGCTAPCMTEVPFSGGADDNGSAPFYVYGADTLLVGDDSGKLHKFFGVFNGVPTENTMSPWPVSVSAHSHALGTPLFDFVTGNAYMGDYQGISEPNCGQPCGFLYRVRTDTGVVVQSARLEYGLGIVDAPLLDQTAGMVYVFAGADGNVNTMSPPCGGSFQSCSGVYQLSATFSAGASGTEETLGQGNQADPMYSGTFDNAYYTSVNHASPTGNLYVLGNTNGDITLYQIPITSNAMGAPTTGPVISSNMSVGGVFSPAMPVTEIFTGTKDYIFTSAVYFGQPMILADCGSPSLSIGCVMGFDVTSGTISGATTPTGATPSAGGVSGIIIDNVATTPAGVSNIYYSTLGNQMCPTSGGTGGCAIQVSQATP